jgi:hypothetical protein
MINIKKIKLEYIYTNDSYDIKENNLEYKEKLKYQIQKNGELLPVLLHKISDEHYDVIDGFARIDIYRELGWDECHANVLENISEKKAQLLKIQLFEGFDFDVLKIAKRFKSICEKLPSDRLEQSINFTKSQIDRYIDIYNWDWSIFEYNNIPDEIKIEQGIKNQKTKTLF